MGISVKEIKKELNGCEISSLEYEGVVGVIKGKAFMDGEEIEVDWHILWDEYIENELGGNDSGFISLENAI